MSLVFWGRAHSPYLAQRPGPAPLITVRGGYRVSRWHYTTIEMHQLRWIEWLRRELAGQPSVLGVHDSGVAAEGALQMRSAKLTAWQVAGSLLGEETAVTQGALVLGTEPGSPAAASGLRIGDLIVSVGDTRVVTVANLQRIIAHSGGQSLELRYRRMGVDLASAVTPERTGGRFALGLRLTAGAALTEVPYPILTGSVWGPSGGLMFTLAYIEARGGGSLAGGRVIAGTGTVAPDGGVGPVGGAADKLRGAQRAGSAVFFVPAGETGELGEAKGVTVVPVVTVSDAVAWLCQHGGSGRICGP